MLRAMRGRAFQSHARRKQHAQDAAALEPLTPAGPGTPIAQMRPENPRAMRRGRRVEQIAPIARRATILEAAEIVFTPNPGVTQDVIDAEIVRLGAGGAKVRIAVPNRPDPPPFSGKHPLEGADDIASVTATASVVSIVVHGPLDTDATKRKTQVDRIERLAIASARHMGSPATTVEVRVIGPRA